MALGANLKRLMDIRKMGNKELSEKSGVPLRTINNILSGVTENPTLETMRLLAKALDCTLDDFDDGINFGDMMVNEDVELYDYLNELHKRPEMKMLFQVAKKASKEDVEKAVKIIEMFKGGSSEEND